MRLRRVGEPHGKRQSGLRPKELRQGLRTSALQRRRALRHDERLASRLQRIQGHSHGLRSHGAILRGGTGRHGVQLGMRHRGRFDCRRRAWRLGIGAFQWLCRGASFLFIWREVNGHHRR
jgi:hypothetical protein